MRVKTSTSHQYTTQLKAPSLSLVKIVGRIALHKPRLLSWEAFLETGPEPQSPDVWSQYWVCVMSI